MLELLSHLLAAVCGQNPVHTWAPGGMWLPCCQRCTGLYAGAAVAMLLHLWLRPVLNGRFLEVHGAFLLAMVPFGFHWLAQGPVLRTLIGVLFGFGLITFLRLPWCGMAGKQCHPYPAWVCYSLILAATLVILPLTAARGGPTAAYVLSGLIAVGALALGSLAVADVGLGLLGALRWLRRSIHRRLAA